MSLTSDLISEFVKVTNDEPKASTESTVFGTTVKVGEEYYVRIDGSDQLTPVSTTTNVEENERVTVLIKDHSATITGNLSSPAPRNEEVVQIGSKVNEFEIVIADKISTEQLEAAVARITNLETDNVTVNKKLIATEAEIDALDVKVANIDEAKIGRAEVETLVAGTVDAKIGEFDFVEADELEATNVKVNSLETTYVDVSGKLSAAEAEIDKLTTEKLDVTWGNIDYANIDQAVMKEFFAASGYIENVTMENGTVTGYLVGVTIRGDLIEGNTIKADKLVIKGDDGLYYKLNFESGNFTDAEEVPTDSIHGSVITAKSITAEKVSVSDLVAFGATIGGFQITGDSEDQNGNPVPGSIHSFAKPTIDSPERGIYMDNEGQVSIGDSNNFLKYYKVVDDEGNETWKMAVSLESLLFGLNSKSSGTDLANLLEHIRVGTYTNPETGNDEPAIEMFEEDTDFKMRLTNTNATFTDGTGVGTKVSTDGVETDDVTVRNKLNQNGFSWVRRDSGTIHKIGLVWEGVDG